nr:MAG TPA: hypothetical protein [Caudoviricetes sp.]
MNKFFPIKVAIGVPFGSLSLTQTLNPAANFVSMISNSFLSLLRLKCFLRFRIPRRSY